ncbi:hypothetical protein AaE_014338 [Aphanomyces astaci]|uniref:OTU domain-containing protein n=1 Tax=Aphanomyces astaci TaxID=112090 RepID=A0A6A4Z1W2_APHAT|nr:hypothetical protein AaE_014338 [Aphanomyces astaci]
MGTTASAPYAAQTPHIVANNTSVIRETATVMAEQVSDLKPRGLELRLQELGLVKGGNVSNGHCLFVAIDCCLNKIREPNVDGNGNLNDPAAQVRVMHLRDHVANFVVRTERNYAMFSNIEYVQQQVKINNWDMKPAVRDFFMRRGEVQPSYPLRKMFWGCSGDIGCYAKILKIDIFVFSETPMMQDPWTLEKHFVHQFTPRNLPEPPSAFIPMSTWSSVVCDEQSSIAILLLYTPGHYIPLHSKL